MKTVYGVGENGYRVGQDHHKAKLTDEEVDLIRDLYEEGLVGYRALAKAFNVSRNTVKDICQYKRRNCFVADFRLSGR